MLPSLFENGKRKRGFAGQTIPGRKEAGRVGGVSAHRNAKGKRCHEYTSETARAAANKRWGKCEEA